MGCRRTGEMPVGVGVNILILCTWWQYKRPYKQEMQMGRLQKR